MKIDIRFVALCIVTALLLSVPCYTGEPVTWQGIVDLKGVACVFEKEPGHLIIADHASQDFSVLPNIQIGDRLFLKYEYATAVYKCIDIQPGYNDGVVRYQNGESAEAVYDLMCYTCTETGVIIVGFERVEVRRSDKCPKRIPA